MMWETPSIFFGGISAESIVWVTLDDGESWRLLKLIQIGSWSDAGVEAEIASSSAQPFG